jgi:hypothetical protein
MKTLYFLLLLTLLPVKLTWGQHPDLWYADTISVCDTVTYYTWVTKDSSFASLIWDIPNYTAFDSALCRDSIIHKPKIAVYLTEAELQKLMDWLHPKRDSLAIYWEVDILDSLINLNDTQDSPTIDTILPYGGH